MLAEAVGEPHVGSTEFLTHPQEGPPVGVPVRDVVRKGAGPTDLVKCLSFALFFVARSPHPCLFQQGRDPSGLQAGAVGDLSSGVMLRLDQCLR